MLLSSLIVTCSLLCKQFCSRRAGLRLIQTSQLVESLRYRLKLCFHERLIYRCKSVTEYIRIFGSDYRFVQVTFERRADLGRDMKLADLMFKLESFGYKAIDMLGIGHDLSHPASARGPSTNVLWRVGYICSHSPPPL